MLYAPYCTQMNTNRLHNNLINVCHMMLGLTLRLMLLFVQFVFKGFNATVIHTPDVNYTTPWLTFKQSYVTFSVQTCESAELILSHIPAVPTYESYKIKLSNGKSYIHRFV